MLRLSTRVLLGLCSPRFKQDKERSDCLCCPLFQTLASYQRRVAERAQPHVSHDYTTDVPVSRLNTQAWHSWSSEDISRAEHAYSMEENILACLGCSGGHRLLRWLALHSLKWPLRMNGTPVLRDVLFPEGMQPATLCT